MASNYPTSKDTFQEPSNPTVATLAEAGTGGNTRAHLEHHRDLGDVLEAVQDKLGLTAGAPLVAGYAAGLWHAPPMITQGAFTPAVGDMGLIRWDFPIGLQIVNLGTWVITASTGGSGALVRSVMYDDNGTGTYPDDLLFDGGTISVETTGFKANADQTAVVMDGKPKWIGSVIQTANTAVSMPSLAPASRGMAIATVPSNNLPAGYIQTAVTGTPPATFTTTRAWSTNVMKTFVKVSA